MNWLFISFGTPSKCYARPPSFYLYGIHLRPYPFIILNISLLLFHTQSESFCVTQKLSRIMDKIQPFDHSCRCSFPSKYWTLVYITKFIVFEYLSIESKLIKNEYIFFFSLEIDLKFHFTFSSYFSNILWPSRRYCFASAIDWFNNSPRVLFKCDKVENNSAL